MDFQPTSRINEEKKEFEKFKLPSKHIEKKFLVGGKNLIEASAAFVHLKHNRGKLKEVRKSCDVPASYYLKTVDAVARLQAAREQLKELLVQGSKKEELLELAKEDLKGISDNLRATVATIDAKVLDNIVRRHRTELDGMERLADFYKWCKEIKEHERKQDILQKISKIMESLLEELEPYESTLGHLAREDKAYKSKADALVTKKTTLMERKESIYMTVRQYMEEVIQMAKNLFEVSFLLHEDLHSRVNLVNRLEEISVETLRQVLDLEARTAVLRKKACMVRAENTWFQWFVDWVLSSLVGIENVAGVTMESSLKDKVHSIIEYHKEMKELLKTVMTESKLKAHSEDIFD